MTDDESYRPPDDDEFELSLIGPGYGESIVLHLGDGEWAVIDSCVSNNSRGVAAPLQYLEALGVKPAEQVKLVVATHWHDDHIRGLAEVVRTCGTSRFICSIALRSSEFLTLVEAYGKQDIAESPSGVREFAAILNELNARRAQPEWALAGNILWKRESGVAGGIHALSPSHRQVELALRSIGQYLPAPLTPRVRVPEPRPNDTAVALVVEFPGVSALLGADLEETADPQTGWTAVVASAVRRERRSQVFKVPHHGSENGHNDDVWTELLERWPLAVLSPFVRGRKPLPSDSDAQRLCGLSGRVLLTSPARTPPQYVSSDELARKIIREAVRYIRQTEGPIGQVRIRCRLDEEAWDPTVELFDAAIQLCAADATASTL